MDERHVRPGVRFAVDAYVNFARTQPWPAAVSLLTELCPDLMVKRIDALQTHYTWIATEGLDYFRSRLTQATEDSEFALRVTLNIVMREKCRAAIAALGFKCGRPMDYFGRVDDIFPNVLKMDSPPDRKPRLARRARLHTDRVSGRPVLLHQEAILVLSTSGYEILRLCDGTHTVPEIIKDLQSRYPFAGPILTQEIPEYIKAISQKGLIERV